MNTKTHYLGKPCRRNHVNEAGKTLRRKDNGNCPDCVAIKRKEMRERKIKLHGSTYTGTPCVRGHLNEAGKSVRWSHGGMCVECSKIHKYNYRQSAAGQESQRQSHWRKAGMPQPTRPAPSGCEICGKENMRGKSLANDHCHATGKFRGWLCTSCNSAIGHLGDSLEGILRAAEYIRKNSPAG